MTKILKKIGNLMRSQSCRSTQYPLFVVQVKKRRLVPDGYGDVTVYLNGDCEEMEESELCEDCEDGDEKIDGCVNCGFRNTVQCEEEWEFDLRSGVFFTEEACEEHIKRNHYHYNEPRSYVIGAWRNDEMVGIMQHILKSTDEEIPSQYR